MSTVKSKDGTLIGYDCDGQGLPVIVVAGALGVRSDHPMNTRMIAALAPHFSVYTYDRRGRGESGDTPPYAVEREVEDIEALIDQAGGSAYLYGLSSGAVLALEVAARLPDKVKKLVMYEPPLIVDDSRPPVPDDYVEQLNAATAAGQPGQAVTIFMTKAIGIPEEFVAQMRTAPMDEVYEEGMKPPEWAEMERVGHTLAYDGMIMQGLMSGKPLPAGRWKSARVPALVVDGGNSDTFMHTGADALAEILPNARRLTLPGQDHAVDPAVLGPVLVEFFNS